jgi:hypothetical protein
MKIRMSDYKDAFKGSTALVLGGGPSLPEDLRKAPLSDHPIIIAVNYHALKLIEADFIVYNDEPKTDPELLGAVMKFKGVRVSPDPTSDVEFDVPVWTGFYSSNTAAWLALWMGCDPVILCGMDCYQGERVYFHDYSHDAPCFHYPLDHHLRPWKEDGKHLLPHPERVKVMSGPLVGVFGKYESKEVPAHSRCEFAGSRKERSRERTLV